MQDGMDSNDELMPNATEATLETHGCIYNCNVCFEPASEPVVTQCGHLFCWPCLYRWMCEDKLHTNCPVCKGVVKESNVIPLYGRGLDQMDPRTRRRKSREVIPDRPPGQRHQAQQRQPFIQETTTAPALHVNPQQGGGGKSYPPRTCRSTRLSLSFLLYLASLSLVFSSAHPTTSLPKDTFRGLRRK